MNESNEQFSDTGEPCTPDSDNTHLTDAADVPSDISLSERAPENQIIAPACESETQQYTFSTKPRVIRSSDGYPCHPDHRSFHLIRLLIGSLMGGWACVLLLFTFGFLGNIDFTKSISQASRWFLVWGSIGGIIAGLFFSIIVAILRAILPGLARTTHPLALVRFGFLFSLLWPFFSLLLWPSYSFGLWVGPIIAFALSWLGTKSNPHAELVPHSTTGRILGTSAGPLIAIGFLLVIINPMYNRGLGSPSQPELILIAVDGLDGSVLRQHMYSSESLRLPNLLAMKDRGSMGELRTTQPLIPAKLWANMMTGTENNGIFNSYSVAEDLDAVPIWDVVASKGRIIGLFQMLPPHELNSFSVFDIPCPETAKNESDPRSRTLERVKRLGKGNILIELAQDPILLFKLARLGVTLDTFNAITSEIVLELLGINSPRITYAKRKIIQFMIETDVAAGLLRTYKTDAVFFRFPSLAPLFIDYLRYFRSNQYGSPPQDVDFSLMAGLSRVIPDAFKQLDRFLEKLKAYTGPNSIICLVSNHGQNQASYYWGHIQFDVNSLLEVTGFSDSLTGENCGEMICFHMNRQYERNFRRSLSEDETSAQNNPLAEFASLLRSSTWKSEENSNISRSIFSVTEYNDRIEVSLRYTSDLSPSGLISIGEWSGTLDTLLIKGEPRSSVIGSTGIMAIQGPMISAGSVPSNPSILDVMPTLLRALGIEISRELQGVSMENIFDSKWLEQHQPQYVRSYKPEPSVIPELTPAGSII